MTIGTQTPFGANLLGALIQNTGLILNPVTAGLVGTSHTVSSYTPGTLVSETCLDKLTSAINAAYVAGTGLLTAPVYEDLIAIGSNSIPALGNSKPPTYTWIGPANSGDTTSLAAQAVSWYPYTGTSTTNTYPSSNPTPRQWSTLTSTTYSPDITQWGWIRLFALQAWNEFNWNNEPSASSIVYKDFVSSFQTCTGYALSQNSTITSLTNAATFLKNTYSNNNDLSSGDITGVNLATTVFGQDLIATGKAIDLSTISTFGLPSNLLRTLQKYNAITASLSYALISAGLQTGDLEAILSGNAQPTPLQERQMYGAYSIIVGVDLANILIPLNCNLTNLDSLVDLLDPKKLFPNSYQSLTMPVYNSGPGPTNAKTYYPIYTNGAVNTSQLNSPAVKEALGFTTITSPQAGSIAAVPASPGYYTQGIIPDDVSIACGAFAVAMGQIKNIKNVPIEKFAQVVANIETTKGLPLTAGTDIPADVTLTEVVSQIAYGSGPNGTFTLSDFFGCMSGLPYQWTDIKNLILQLQTTTLISIYEQIYTAITNPSGPNVDADVAPLIVQANNEIAAIQTRNPIASRDLNRMWDITGTQLTNEQRARNIALTPVPTPRSNDLSTFPMTLLSYVDAVPGYGRNTAPHMQAQTVEAISDTTTVGGQSQIALMRATRNEDRMALAGIPIDNGISPVINPLTTKILMGNGTVSIAAPNQGIPSGNATFTIPADSNVLEAVEPVGHFENPDNSYCLPTAMNPAPVLGTIPYEADTGQDLAGPNITQVSNPITPVAGGFLPQGTCTPLNLGKPTAPGSLGGSPYINLIPPQLSIPYISSILTSPAYSVADAIDEVVRCNCDCWLQ